MKVMLLTKSIKKRPKGGRELLCNLNYHALRSIFSDHLILFETSVSQVSGVKSHFNGLRGHIDGLNSDNIDLALMTIKNKGIQKVFVDGSNLGGFVNVLKKKMPDVEVATFFHNVETRFFWGSFLSKKSLHAFGVLIVNYLAERQAVRNSDKIICLSERDSRLLKLLYGRTATHISPIAMEDNFQASSFDVSMIKKESFALFVGGTFYANLAGISWFVREVVPRIDYPIYIVGNGFENLRDKLEVPGKVIVIGVVESIAEWYNQAQFVIAPIFDGSGMKTKVAEALMFGKKVIGSPEAFSGYEEIVGRAGWVCRTSDEFVAAIQIAQKEESSAFDIGLREIFLKRYSLAAAQERLRAILQTPI